jgi:pilus assembly protein CpaB
MSRGRVYLLLGIVLAAISAVLVYTSIQGARPKPVPTRSVLVAAQVIPPRTYVTPENSPTLFAVANWPIAIVPGGALASPTQALNHVVVANVEKGAPVFVTNLSTDQTNGQTGLSIDIPAGDVALSIPVSAVTAAGGAIAPGDYIDMLVSVKAPDTLNPAGDGTPRNPADSAPGPAAAANSASPAGRPAAGSTPAAPTADPNSAAGDQAGAQTISLTTLQRVKVIAMGQNFGGGTQAAATKGAPSESNAGAPTMTLLLSHQEALLVKYAKDSGSTIDVVLRRYDDKDTATTKPVDLNYFLNQFGYHLIAPNQPAK